MTEAVPVGWAIVALDDVVEVRDFEREPINSAERHERISGKQNAELFPYYGATGQVGWIDGCRSEGQQVLLGEDGAPFLDPNRDKAYLVDGRYWVNNHAHVLRGMHEVMDNRLLMHQLNITDYSAHVSGSTRLKLTSAAMKRIPLVVPPHREQLRIVEKLEELMSELNAGVAELKAAQRKLAAFRQSLLKAAVEGTLTADWRAARANDGTSQETGGDLLQRILAERRVRCEHKQLARYAEQGKTPPKGWQTKYPVPAAIDLDGLPVLPRDWTWTSLDSLIGEGPQNGLYVPASKYGRGHSILRIDDFQTDWIRQRSELKQVEVDEGTANQYALNQGDLIVNRVNSLTHLGKSLIAGPDLAGALFESNMMRARLTELVSPRFVGIYLRSVHGRGQLTKNAKWAVNQASINQTDVKSTAVPVPPRAEQLEIAELLEQASEEINRQSVAIEQGLAQAAAQRRNILKAAFAGQLVPQNPADEPASVLLERIRAARAAHGPTTRKRGRKARENA